MIDNLEQPRMSANLQGDWQSSKIKLACRRAKGPHPAPKNIFSSQGSSSFWRHNWCNMIFHPLVSVFDNDSNSLMLAMFFQILHEHRLWFSSMDHEACSIFFQDRHIIPIFERTSRLQIVADHAVSVILVPTLGRPYLFIFVSGVFFHLSAADSNAPSSEVVGRVLL